MRVADRKREIRTQDFANSSFEHMQNTGVGHTLATSRIERALRRKLLAQRPPLSEARSAMNSSARSQNCARVVIATVLFAAFSWTLLVSVSPQLHGCIHSDANRSDHVCAITLIASGSYEHGAQPPVISPPQFDVRFAASAELTSTWVKPLFLNAHIFAHAPPALV